MDSYVSALIHLIRTASNISADNMLYTAVIGTAVIAARESSESLPNLLEPAGTDALQSLLERVSSGEEIPQNDLHTLIQNAVQPRGNSSLLMQSEFRESLLPIVGKPLHTLIHQLVTGGDSEIGAQLLLLCDQYDWQLSGLKSEFDDLRRRLTSATLGDTLDNRAVTFRVFLSSPGDVSDERKAVLDVIEQLRYDPLLKNRVLIEPIAWDKQEMDTPMLGTMTPQEAINEGLAKPSDCDIVVVIFWSRMGTPLPFPDYQKEDGTQYLSGTEWEYRDAYNKAKKDGHPLLVIYRRMEEPVIGMRDPKRAEKIEQFERVEAFFSTFSNPDGSITQGYNAYHTREEFRQKFERHLRLLIVRLLQGRTQGKTTTSKPAAAPMIPAAPLWKGSPFPGLHAFTNIEAPIFFGRGRETDRLLGLIEKRRFVGVVGASGSGKSSIVGAGLIPRLEANAIEGSKNWLLPRYNTALRQWEGVRFTPSEISENPFSALAIKLAPYVGIPPREVAEQLYRQPAQIIALIEQALAGHESWAQLFIFIDQFEELFTTVTDAYRQRFIEMLAALTQSRARVVVTMRSDFYQHCVDHETLAHLLTDGSFNLAAPTDTLLEMITRPAERAGLVFEEGLPGRILKDTGSEPGALALMAYTLDMLYLKCKEAGKLTHHAYDVIGGVQGAIGVSAHTVFEQLSLAAQATLPYTFGRLVTVNDVGVPTRRRARLSDFDTLPAAQELIQAFLKARLLVSDLENAHPIVEVAHEALFRSWGQLQQWIQTAKSDLQLERSVINAASMWDARGRPAGLLWRHEELLPIYELRDRLGIQFAPEVEAFIELESVRLIRDYLQDPKIPVYRWQNIRDRLLALGAFSVQPIIDALDEAGNEPDINLLTTLVALNSESAVPTFERLSRHFSEITVRESMDSTALQNILGTSLQGLTQHPQPEHFSIFLNALNHPSNDVKSIAAIGLGKLRDPRAVDALIRMLQQRETTQSGSRFGRASNESFRSQAALALGEIGDPRAVDWLIIALNDNATSSYVAQALAMIGDVRAVEPVAQAFIRLINANINLTPELNKHYTRYGQALIEFGAPAAEALIALKGRPEELNPSQPQKPTSRFGSTSSESVFKGKDAAAPTAHIRIRLHEIGKVLTALQDTRAIELLISALLIGPDRANLGTSGFLGTVNKPAPAQPIEAISDTLGKWGEIAVAPLVEALNQLNGSSPSKVDIDIIMRRRTDLITALGKTQSIAAVEALIQMLASSDLAGARGSSRFSNPNTLSNAVVSKIISALKAAGNVAIGPLMSILETQMPEKTQLVAIRVLGELQAEQAIPILLDLLTKMKSSRNDAIVEALAAMGEQVIEPLIAYITDGKSGTSFAVQALTQLASVQERAFKPLLDILENCTDKTLEAIENAFVGVKESSWLYVIAVHFLNSDHPRQRGIGLRIMADVFADAFKEHVEEIAPRRLKIIELLSDTNHYRQLEVETPVPYLYNKLDRIPVSVGMYAAITLHLIDPEACLTLFNQIPFDADKPESVYLLTVLLEAQLIDAAPYLSLLTLPQPMMQFVFIKILNNQPNAESIPHLLKLIESANVYPSTIKIYVAYLLGMMRAKEAVELLLHQLETVDSPFSDYARVLMKALASIGDLRAFDTILAHAQQRNALAIEAIGQFKDVRAVEPLLALFEDDKGEKEYLLWSVVRALGQIGDPKAIPHLLRVLSGESSLELKRRCLDALGEIGDASAANAIYPYLVGIPGENRTIQVNLFDNRSLIESAVFALAHMNDLRALPHLISEYTDYSDLIREKYGESAIEPIIEQYFEQTSSTRLSDWVIPLVASYGEAALDRMQIAIEQRSETIQKTQLEYLIVEFYSRIKTPRCIEILAGYLRHPHQDVRYEAGKVLHKFNALDVLAANVWEMIDVSMLDTLIGALMLGDQPQDWQLIREILLKHPVPEARFKALHVLKLSANPDHLPALHQALKNYFADPGSVEHMIIPQYVIDDEIESRLHSSTISADENNLYVPEAGQPVDSTLLSAHLSAIVECADAREFQTFVTWLEYGSIKYQDAALQGLIKLADARTVPELDRLYHSSANDELRERIAEAVTYFDDPHGVPVLLNQLWIIANEKSQIPRAKQEISLKDRCFMALKRIGSPAFEPIRRELEASLPDASQYKPEKERNRLAIDGDFLTTPRTHYVTFLIHILRDIQDPRGVSLLHNIMDLNPDLHPMLLKAIIYTLGAYPDTDNIQRLKGLFNTLTEAKDAAMRVEVFESLCELIPQEMSDTILEALAGDNQDMVRAAVYHAPVVGERAVMPLIARLYNPGDLLVQLIEALGIIDDERVIDPIIGQLNNDNEFVVLAVLEALKRHKSPRAIRPLIQALETSSSPDTRFGGNKSSKKSNAIIEVLVAYGEAALADLEAMKNSNSKEIREGVAKAIQKITAQSA